MKESNDLLRTDGKRPDVLTLLPWREGRCLVWDVTIANTIAQSWKLVFGSRVTGSSGSCFWPGRVEWGHGFN